LAEKGPEKYKHHIRKLILDNIENICQNKFASNIVEKTIRVWSHEFIEELFTKMQQTSKVNELPILLVLMQDNFANYVVQRLFEYGDENIKKRIYLFLKSFANEIVLKNNYSKHVYQSIESFFLPANYNYN